MQRLAFFSDIHGNSIALDAVFNDICALGGADHYYILGDLAAIGFDPIGVLERLRHLANATIIHGNTERYLLTGHAPGPTTADCQTNPALWPARVETAASFAWSQGAVSAAGWLPWLNKLPLEHRFLLPDGTRILCVHASPGQDESIGLHPGTSEMMLEELFGEARADLVFVGHTHWPVDIMLGRTRLINTGSVSNPFPPDLRASYVLVEADEAGYRLEHRRIEYDRAAVITELQRLNHPGRDFIISHLSGNIHPPFAL